MAIDERSRNELFNRLTEVLGEEPATVLMAHLPPVGWAEVATKRDLDQLRIEMNSRFEIMEARFDAKLEATVSKMTYRMMLVNAASTFTVAGLAFAAARLV